MDFWISITGLAPHCCGADRRCWTGRGSEQTEYSLAAADPTRLAPSDLSHRWQRTPEREASILEQQQQIDIGTRWSGSSRGIPVPTKRDRHPAGSTVTATTEAAAAAVDAHLAGPLCVIVECSDPERTRWIPMNETVKGRRNPFDRKVVQRHSGPDDHQRWYCCRGSVCLSPLSYSLQHRYQFVLLAMWIEIRIEFRRIVWVWETQILIVGKDFNKITN